MRLLLSATCAAACVASAASADFTDLTYTGFGATEAATILSPGYSGAIVVGQLFINLANTTGSSSYLDGNYIAYCADVYQVVNAGPNQYEILPVSALPMNAPMGAAAAGGIEDLYAFAAGAQFGGDGAYAAAFQLAMWEVIHDFGNLDLSTGNFQASDMTANAQAYAAALLAAVGAGASANLIGLGNESYQDMIIEVVPGPGALGLVGIAGLLRGRRRR